MTPEEIFESNLVADQSPHVELGRLEVGQPLHLGGAFATAEEAAHKVYHQFSGRELHLAEAAHQALHCLILLPVCGIVRAWSLIELAGELSAFPFVFTSGQPQRL